MANHEILILEIGERPSNFEIDFEYKSNIMQP